MKCRECDCCKKGFYKSIPDEYICTGVKEPFVIMNIDNECTEYPEYRALKCEKLLTEDLLVVGFDNANNGDSCVLSITRVRGNKCNVINTFYDKDAIEMYKHLTSWR